jgi:flagellar export protein FliJ
VSVFRFRLARVLRARRTAEEVQRAQVYAAEQVARAAEGVAERCAELARGAQDSVRAGQSAQELDAAAVLIAQDAHARAQAVEQATHETARSARGSAEAERTVWKSLRTDVRGLERLEERARERFRLEAETQEERSIEDAAARRAEAARRKGVVR